MNSEPMTVADCRVNRWPAVRMGSGAWAVTVDMTCLRSGSVGKTTLGALLGVGRRVRERDDVEAHPPADGAVPVQRRQLRLLLAAHQVLVAVVGDDSPAEMHLGVELAPAGPGVLLPDHHDA